MNTRTVIETLGGLVLALQLLVLYQVATGAFSTYQGVVVMLSATALFVAIAQFVLKHDDRDG